MIMRKIKYIYIIIISLFITSNSIAQRNRPPKTGDTKAQMKRLQKLEKKEKKEQAEAEKELIKSHRQLQSKDVRKRMKKTKRKSNRIKKGKHAEVNWKLWFFNK